MFVQQGSLVRRFDANGDPVSSWDTAPLGTALRGVAADASGNVYLADAAQGRVLKYSANGVLLDQWFGRGEGGGESGACPSGIATDAAGNVYPTCGRAGWFEKLSPTGGQLLQRASCLIGPIAVRTDGSVLVTDCGTIRKVLQYAASGVTTIGKSRPLGGSEKAFAAPGEVGPWRPGGLYVSGGAAGVAVDTSGLLWVADPDNQRVQAFQSDGQVVATCRPPTNNRIKTITAGAAGALYVSDFLRVQRLIPAAAGSDGCGTDVRKLRFAQRLARLSRHRVVAIRVRCDTAGDPCRGTLRITNVHGKRLGSKRFELGAGSANVQVRLSRGTARALRRHSSLRIRLSATVRSTLGTPAVAKKQVTLRRAAR